MKYELNVPYRGVASGWKFDAVLTHWDGVRYTVDYRFLGISSEHRVRDWKAKPFELEIFNLRKLTKLEIALK